jgi:hypothetical protein
LEAGGGAEKLTSPVVPRIVGLFVFLFCEVLNYNYRQMTSVIFTPSDEPYLGRQLLHAFDNLICSCLELNSKCAPASHGRELSDFQHAMCILVPQTITLGLSIRELIRQGYLFGAKVLVRPFTERAVTALYLFHNPEALKIWNDGWEHRKRPTLQKMIENLNEKLQKGPVASLKGITHELNSATHGDPLSAKWNVVLRDDGLPAFLPSKNLKSPGLADEICAETIPWLATTMVVMGEAFGQEEAKSLGGFQ